MSGTLRSPAGPPARSIPPALLDVLACPDDGGPLEVSGEALRCTRCSVDHPYRGGIVSFLPAERLDEVREREQASRDREADWYAALFPQITDIVEVPATIEGITEGELPDGPLLDLGAGTGRLTDHLARDTGRPVVAVDYSLGALELLVERCAGLPVLAVHADARSLPLRTHALAAAVSAELYPVMREEDRAQLLRELRRVLRPGARAAVSTLNYSLVFRVWGLLGNPGARQGEHLFGSGSDCYYVRQTTGEFRSELAGQLEVDEVTGIRNIPSRTISSVLGRLAGPRLAEPFERFMVRRGHRLDRAWERLPLSRGTGFLLLARVRTPV